MIWSNCSSAAYLQQGGNMLAEALAEAGGGCGQAVRAQFVQVVDAVAEERQMLRMGCEILQDGYFLDLQFATEQIGDDLVVPH